jgi:CRISPR system Cascade subunit CasA
MDPSFSLLSAKWIPVKRADGSHDPIAPHEITSDLDSNPIVSFAWPRPDFDLAAHEFLIGLFAVAFPPKGQRDWLRYFRTPPPPEELREVFQPYTAAFSLDGEGPRFLQDFSPLEGESWPVEALFIEAPGTSKATIDKNNDLLVKRGRFSVLSRASAAMALYTLQQFAPEGGSGHRTSLRGGGPLVTFIVPGAPENGRALALSQKLWLHVPQSRPLDTGRMALAFPWLAPTITSESKVTISEVDADRLQAFFGMPRRIRLLFEKNDTLRPCDVTGVVDEIVVRRFTMRPRGVEYGVWRHPLTPYYKDNTVTRPVHTPEGSVGYRQWLGLVYESANGSRLPARAVVEARPRLRDAGSSYMGDARLFAGGYKAKSANILAFAEAEMPIHVVENEDLEKRISNFSETLVEAASTATSALCLKIRTALLGSKRKGDMGSTLLDAPRERLWTDTERDFHNLLTDAIEQLENDKTGDAQIALAERWRGTLEQRALRIFDETAPLDDFGATDPRQLVEARRSLVLAFKGFGKMGRGLFNELGLPAAQPKADRSNEAKAKRKEDTRA